MGGVFERFGGSEAGPSGTFERSGGSEARPSGTFERSGGSEARSSGTFERSGGPEQARAAISSAQVRGSGTVSSSVFECQVAQVACFRESSRDIRTLPLQTRAENLLIDM